MPNAINISIMKMLNRLSNYSLLTKTCLPFTYQRPFSNLTHKSLNNRLTFSFSRSKKGKVDVQAQIPAPSIHIRQFSQAYDGFVLYQNTDGNRIKMISMAFLACFLSAFWSYTKTQDDEIKINFMIMGGLLTAPFLIFQFRTAKTLKRLVLDKTGENVILTRFSMGGFRDQSTKTKVEVLRGIGKAFVFGGSVIKGGGMYGLEERNYWFQSKYIKERDVFQEVTFGKRVKINTSKAFE